jgi:hypothetical protein
VRLKVALYAANWALLSMHIDTKEGAAPAPAAVGLGAGYTLNVGAATAAAAGPPAETAAPAKGKRAAASGAAAALAGAEQVTGPHLFGDEYHGVEAEQRGTEMPAAEEAEG